MSSFDFKLIIQIFGIKKSFDLNRLVFPGVTANPPTFLCLHLERGIS